MAYSRTTMLAENLLLLALTAAPPDVLVELQVTEKLRLVRDRDYDEPTDVLRGSLRVTLRNRTDTPITLWHPGPHGLLFADAKGKSHLIIHPCQCVKEQRHPEQLHLGPGDQTTFTLEEWGCDGAWSAPPLGSHQVSYRILPAHAFRPAPAANTGELIERCRKAPYEHADFWKSGWSSKPITIVLKRKKR